MTLSTLPTLHMLGSSLTRVNNRILRSRRAVWTPSQRLPAFLAAAHEQHERRPSTDSHEQGPRRGVHSMRKRDWQPHTPLRCKSPPRWWRWWWLRRLSRWRRRLARWKWRGWWGGRRHGGRRGRRWQRVVSCPGSESLRNRTIRAHARTIARVGVTMHEVASAAAACAVRTGGVATAAAASTCIGGETNRLFSSVAHQLDGTSRSQPQPNDKRQS